VALSQTQVNRNASISRPILFKAARDKDLERFRTVLDSGVDINSELDLSDNAIVEVPSMIQPVHILRYLCDNKDLQYILELQKHKIAWDQLLSHAQADHSVTLLEVTLPSIADMAPYRKILDHTDLRYFDGYSINELVEAGKTATVEYLLKKGLKLEALYKMKAARVNLLSTAVKRGNREMIDLLLSSGADPNRIFSACCGTGLNSPLLVALSSNDEAIVRMFIQHGAELSRSMI
jgi:hypothetical protein